MSKEKHEKSISKGSKPTIREYIWALYLRLSWVSWFFSLKPLLLHSENDVKISSTYPSTCTYVWYLGRESTKAKPARRVSQALGQPPGSHSSPPRAEGGPRLGRGVQPPSDEHPQPALSSVQPFFLFLRSVFSQHFHLFSGLWQLCTAGCLLSRFLALSPLSFWVLSWQRLVQSVKQPISICLHLVLYRSVRIAPKRYLIFKLSVSLLLPRWTGVLDAGWSVISGRGGIERGINTTWICSQILGEVMT